MSKKQKTKSDTEKGIYAGAYLDASDGQALETLKSIFGKNNSLAIKKSLKVSIGLYKENPDYFFKLITT